MRHLPTNAYIPLSFYKSNKNKLGVVTLSEWSAPHFYCLYEEWREKKETIAPWHLCGIRGGVVSQMRRKR
ncbi:MAG: hypothetical protein N3D75_04720 [Candidatus Aenigmarchaeota archaeon]|nr:hypothetical protein [Candidatus Aenigmarchaeota archaeon]